MIFTIHFGVFSPYFLVQHPYIKFQGCRFTSPKVLQLLIELRQEIYLRGSSLHFLADLAAAAANIVVAWGISHEGGVTPRKTNECPLKMDYFSREIHLNQQN